MAAWVSGGGGAEFGICPLESVGGGLVYRRGLGGGRGLGLCSAGVGRSALRQ